MVFVPVSLAESSVLKRPRQPLYTVPLEGRRESIDNDLKQLQLATLFYLRYHPL